MKRAIGRGVMAVAPAALAGCAAADPAAGPPRQRVAAYETALVQDYEIGSTNFGASTETIIRLSRARVRDLACTPTGPARARCTYLTDWCSGEEPLERPHYCRRTHDFTRRASDGLWMMDGFEELRERALE